MVIAPTWCQLVEALRVANQRSNDRWLSPLRLPEYKGNGQHRGRFSYFLMDTLSKTNGKLTYRDLFGRTNALVRSMNGDQSPQLEVNNSQDENKFFLDGAIAELEPYFIVKNDKTYGWVIEGGAFKS